MTPEWQPKVLKANVPPYGYIHRMDNHDSLIKCWWIYRSDYHQGDRKSWQMIHTWRIGGVHTIRESTATAHGQAHVPTFSCCSTFINCSPLRPPIIHYNTNYSEPSINPQPSLTNHSKHPRNGPFSNLWPPSGCVCSDPEPQQPPLSSPNGWQQDLYKNKTSTPNAWWLN